MDYFLTSVFLCVGAVNLAIAANLLCYDCNGGRECDNPERYNVRTVNCHEQYPTLQQNETIVCLTLDIHVLGDQGIDYNKSGYYRGCRVVPIHTNEYKYCTDLKQSVQNTKLSIRSCKYCDRSRCI